MLKACIRRDPAAWSAFTEKYSPLISRSISCRLRKHGFCLPQEDIEDIRQTVLASLWQERKLETVSNIDTIAYWLAAVSGNMAMQAMRKNRLRARVAVDLALEGGEAAADALLPEAASPCDELARQELRRKVDDAIDSLPIQERFVIQLHLIHGRDYDEIARLMRLTTNTVASYVRRAKEKLKEELREYL